MHLSKALVMAFITLDAGLSAFAALFVTRPTQGSTCHGGEDCTIEWLDDGNYPLLSAFGVATVGLHTGNLQLVQTIQSVDVSRSISLTFTPNPEAGPNSDTYYVCFTSTSLQQNGTSALAFSPFFRLDQMSGSFASPLPSATSSLPLPSTLEQPSSASGFTITVGTLSTSRPPITSLSATASPSTSSPSASASFTSGFVTSTTSSPPASETSSSSTSAPPSTASSFGDIVPANGSISKLAAPSLLALLPLCLLLLSLL